MHNSRAHGASTGLARGQAAAMAQPAAGSCEASEGSQPSTYLGLYQYQLLLYMYMYMYMHMYLYVYVYICICIYIYTYVYICL